MAAAQQTGVNHEDGQNIGKDATSKISFYGISSGPIAQRASSAQTTIVATFVAVSSGFGFTTSLGVVSIIAAVQEIQATLTLLGLWKGQA
jgi:hypothetical protein